MGDINDYDFSRTDAGASHVYNEEAGQIRVGGYICIKGNPCKVSAVSTSKTGKHGHAKCNFTALDIFTGKKYEEIIPSTHNTDVPFVKSQVYSLADISTDGFLSLVDEEGNLSEDVSLPDFPENFAREIRQTFENAGDKTFCVTVLSAMGKRQVVAIKEEQLAK